MPHSPGAPVLGVVGLGLALLAALIAFVVAMEYDPDAAAFLDGAATDAGTVLAFDGDTATIEVESAGIGPTDTAVDSRWRGVLDPGDTVMVAHRADRPGDLRLRDDLPQSPRTAGGFVTAGVVFVLAAVAVGSDPAALYPHEPEQQARPDGRAVR